MKLLIRSRWKIWSWKGVRVAKRNIYFMALPWSLHTFLTVVILIFSLRANFVFVITWKTSKFLKIKKIKHFNTIFTGYFPFTIIIKYWQYSTYCIIHSWDYPTVGTSRSSTPYCPSPLVTTSLFSLSVSLLRFFLLLLLYSLLCCIV